MYDVVIIGAGPAGLSASIYAKRAGLSAITVEQSAMSGGQVLTTYEVDNYPGFPGINGFDLGMRFREHADGLSCEFQEAEVLRVEENGDGYLVTTSRGELKTKTIVAAMGAEHAKLNIPGEEELAGMGVSYCATCDGAFSETARWRLSAAVMWQSRMPFFLQETVQRSILFTEETSFVLRNPYRRHYRNFPMWKSCGIR